MVYLVSAVINPSQLDDVTDALQAVGVDGMTVSEARGRGGHGDRVEVYRGSEYHVDFAPKVKVEVICDVFEAERVLAAIVDAAHSGRIGDGIAWISPIERFVGIRTKGIDVSSA